jgi:hypothetical protein
MGADCFHVDTEQAFFLFAGWTGHLCQGRLR